MAKILIADDEKRIVSLLSVFLKKQGYDVIYAFNGKEALQKFYSDNQIELVILDVMMPYLNGYSVCKEIKKQSDVPVIILTARSEESDEVDAFDSGADDYISKPFSFPVLIKRVNSLMRRKKKAEDTFSYQLLSVNFLSHVVNVDNREVSLTPKEFKILEFLCRNQGLVMSRQQILDHIEDIGGYPCEMRNVDTHIKNLRIKLGLVCGEYIKTVRGCGYKIG